MSTSSSTTASYGGGVFSWFKTAALSASGLMVVALYFKQNEYIYRGDIPSDARTNVLKPLDFSIKESEEVKIRTPDEETLHCYIIKPSAGIHSKPKATIIMFHGNAGNIGHRLPIAKLLAEEYGYNVVMVEYRGYGDSTGHPNETGLNVDAQAALDFVRGREDLNNTEIVIFGQSLGGAVAISLVQKNKDAGDIAALVVENTFRSIPTLIPSIIPIARFVTFLCHQIWASEKLIPDIKTIPVLFLSGVRDEIVPYGHMRTLWEKCQSRIKVWKEFPEGTHNETVGQREYFPTFHKFIQKHVLKAKSNDDDEEDDEDNEFIETDQATSRISLR